MHIKKYRINYKVKIKFSYVPKKRFKLFSKRSQPSLYLFYIPEAKQNPSPDKYKYIDTDDSEKIWTAQGQTSKSTTAVIEAGKTLEYFAI